MKSTRARLIGASAAASIAVSGSAHAADIVIGMPNWTTVQAKAHILERIIEDNFGLDVEIQTGTNAVVFEAMDRGSMHIHPETWLPNQQNLHDTYVGERGSVVRTSNSTEDNTGMCVLSRTAEELGVTSITDLSDPAIAAQFDNDGDGRGEIFIGAPGWASTIAERVRARDYGYDETMELLEIEDGVAYGNVDSIAVSGGHWVGYCAETHYLFRSQDVVMLSEPPHDPDTWHIVHPTDDPDWLAQSRASTGWRPAYLHVAYASALQETHPEVVELLEGMSLTVGQLVEMSYAIGVERQDPDQFAEEWTINNADLVASWLAN